MRPRLRLSTWVDRDITRLRRTVRERAGAGVGLFRGCAALVDVLVDLVEEVVRVVVLGCDEVHRGRGVPAYRDATQAVDETRDVVLLGGPVHPAGTHRVRERVVRRAGQGVVPDRGRYGLDRLRTG